MKTPDLRETPNHDFARACNNEDRTHFDTSGRSLRLSTARDAHAAFTQSVPCTVWHSLSLPLVEMCRP